MKVLTVLRREIVSFLVCLSIVLVVLPVFLGVSTSLFESRTGGWETAKGFLNTIWEGIQLGVVSSWVIVLTPYLLYTAFRLLRWGWTTVREKTRRRRVERAH